jgi:hypothetical protein
VVTDPLDAARDIADARARLLAFAWGCSEEQWRSSPLGDADPRSVAVIVDHVADAYDYIGGWVRSLVAGESVEVNPEIVDELNARHASDSSTIERDHVTGHLQSSGDALIALVGELSVDDLAIGDGRVEVFAKIAARHADSHRSELEVALG